MAGVDNSDNFPEPGKVRNVSQKWRVYEDGAMAYHMQNEEFDYKYGLNRFNRRTVREDIPVAKVVHSKEEERIQREQMLHLERQKAIADRDAELARKTQMEEQRRIAAHDLAMQSKDEEIARLAQLEEQRNFLAFDKNVEEDAVLASQFQTAELIESERAKVQMEMNDEQIARKLQEKEKERYERKKMEREIAKQRKALQREQAETAGNVLVGRMETQQVVQSQGFRDMRVTDDDRLPVSYPVGQEDNVFTAIDPTVHSSVGRGTQQRHPSTGDPPLPLPAKSSRTRQGSRDAPTPASSNVPHQLNYTEHLAAQQAAMVSSAPRSPHRTDVEYADLNDMSAVQGQKRSSLKRDDKKKNCKQQ